MDAFLETVDSLDHQTVDKILDKNSDEIAKVFGGWTNVLKLCLSNPAVTNIIIDHDENFVALNRLVGLITTDDHIAQSTKNKQSVKKHEQTNPSPKITTKIKTKDTGNSNHNNVVCHNLVQFYTSSIIMNTNRNDIPLFRYQMTCLSGNTISKIVSFTSNRLWFVCLGCMSVAMVVSAEIVCFINFNGSAVYDICQFLWDCGNILMIIYSISALLHINVTIVQLIIQTFDFWFKCFNVFGFCLAHIMIENLSIGNALLLTASASLGAFCIFVTDAFPMSIAMRNIGSVIVGVIPTFLAVLWFFKEEKEVVWNPFESMGGKYSQISLNTLRVSSMANLALFLLKPIMSNTFRKLRKRIYYGNIDDDNNTDINNNGHDKKDFVHKSYFLYKRPKICWQKRVVESEYIVERPQLTNIIPEFKE